MSETLSIINPATETEIQTLAVDTQESIAEKFNRAQKAQQEWAKLPYVQRAATIALFNEFLVDEKERLALVMTSETGKPITQSQNEIGATPARVQFFLDEAEECMQVEDQGQDGNTAEAIRYEPLGVIANISAWNYPYFVGTNVFIPALLTGNAVLYKPSEFSTLTGLAIGELLHKAGIPKDIFQVIVGGGQQGAALLEQDIAGVFFTGSYATGKKIAEAAASKLIKVQLELGGKDPTYVREDVDVAQAAASTADGAFYNAGQSCCAVERLYVHEKIYDEFVKKFVETVQNFNLGDPTKPDTYIGSLARAPQVGVLEAQLQDALQNGAEILTGGKKRPGPGAFFEPTVVVNVNHHMKIMREESFGPIIGIQKVNSDEEALKLMNDTDYGLTAGVFTKDRSAAERLMNELNAGSVYWNCCDRVSPRLPWTGRKHSGIGSTLSQVGIRTFLQPKAYHLRD